MTTDSSYNIDNVLAVFKEEIDAVYIIDAESDSYISVKANSMFSDMFGERGSYLELSRTLMFHFSDSDKEITPEYHVFLPKLNKFQGKYSRRVKIFYNKKPIIVQMTIYPFDSTDKHILFLNELDNSDYMQEFYTKEKENNIKSTYLFSMHVDLTLDMCNSVSVTEMSDDPMNYSKLKYSQWRMMIVNMIYSDDQPMFLQYTDPEYLKTNLVAGRTMSLDCQMQNLHGEFIWVKLIFSKIETLYNDNFRFVFMVQDINESSIRLMADLKRYEELSNLDSLTGVYNHGKIESELYRGIELKKEKNTSISFVMIDIDYFKNINDTYGHAVGDYVLKSLVFLIKVHFSKYNISLGRWGGEEFIGICIGMTAAQLYEITENLRKSIADHTFETIGSITCSIGVIEVSDKENVNEAFERLDKALYAAKAGGRNQVVCG